MLLEAVEPLPIVMQEQKVKRVAPQALSLAAQALAKAKEISKEKDRQKRVARSKAETDKARKDLFGDSDSDSDSDSDDDEAGELASLLEEDEDEDDGFDEENPDAVLAAMGTINGQTLHRLVQRSEFLLTPTKSGSAALTAEATTLKAAK